MLQMPTKSRQILSVFFILVFALYYADICFFYHSHVINGATIVHSHFHSKAHTQTGTHSESELTLISALSVLQSVQPTVCFISFGVLFFLQIINSFFHNRIYIRPK
ncbi:MAG: hypothetical protein PHF73_04035, partial [Massilibacteroides sp.]|nr:hypothetical protein [Massilibacteroides sp.]